MTTVRVAILGTGNVVRSYHLPALAADERARVVALANRRRQSLDELAREHGIEKTYTDLKHLADDPDVDAVINALPNYLHAPVTIMMLEAGRHVLCEKPMATSAADARKMVEAAESAGRTLLIGHVWRLHPGVRWLREVVASGKIGKVFKVRAHAVVAGRGPRAKSWFVQPELAGGGALADVGIHSIDLLSFLFGDRLKPVNVSARVGNDFRRLAVEDSADLRVRFDGGMVADIKAGWYHDHADAPHGAIELFGTEGSARTMPAELRVRAAGVNRTIEPPVSSEHPDQDPSVYAAQASHFLDCVLGKCAPICDGRQGLWDVSLLDAAYAAARRETGSELGDTPAPAGTIFDG
jgi:predicted dehydrogenase